ncbi:GLPGLI family protein [uncultured Chryseobacterium sp.]|uniref:GLPGLI family protein n=1 Tax=uncultured Chryseobacterium sp. TaxID=259322 RepID=UPI0025FF6A67|nr:GLPGLI family protein [uncultured Chryseobacterium sp.]
MKYYKLPFLFLIFVSVFCYSQISRFFYELKYRPGLSDTISQSALFALDVGDKFSLFRDYKNISQDSLLKRGIEHLTSSGINTMEKLSVEEPDFSYIIKKTSEIEYLDRIGNDNYVYAEAEKFEWKIQAEKQLIKGFQCQKATTVFSGREWVAWFTSDIPISDGPYKFRGLPGLILQAYDLKKDYYFSFAGSKMIHQKEYLSDKLIAKNAIPVSKQKFYEIENQFKKDPFGQAYTSLASSDDEIKRKLDIEINKIRSWYLKNNNPIELADHYIELSGQITNEKGEPIPYVNIGILNGMVGTVTDHKGNYTMNISSYLNGDIVRISAVGYENLDIPIENFINQDKKQYHLSKLLKTSSIEEVIVSNKQKNKILGIKSESKNIRIGFNNGISGQEIGTMIKNKNKLKIKKLNINILESSFEHTPFRINIYKIEPDGSFLAVLNETVLVDINSRDSFTTKSVDFTPYNIIVDGDLAVTLELLDSKTNGELYFSGSVFSKGIIRKTSQSKFIEASINPSINIEVSILNKN